MKVLCIVGKDILKPACQFLESKGLQVVAVSDGNKALHLVWSERPDVVIVDEQLPGKDGLALYHEIKSVFTLREPHVVLLASGRSVEHRLDRLMQVVDWHETASTVPLLSPWNPLDPFRLLWWVLATPWRLKAHREAFGSGAERSLSRLIGTTLSVLTLFFS